MFHQEIINNYFSNLHFNSIGSLYFGYDVAILSLESNAVINQYVQVAILPRQNAPTPAGMKLIAAGWGFSAILGEALVDYSIQLLEKFHKFLWAVKQKSVAIERCTHYGIKNLKNSTYEPDSVICGASPETGMSGPFHGDSGGMRPKLH